MQKELDLLERICEITANSVSPEEFEEMWGCTIDDHVADMMDRIHRLEGKDSSPANGPKPAKANSAAAATISAAEKMEKLIENNSRKENDDNEGKFLIGPTGKQKVVFKLEKPESVKMVDFKRTVRNITVRMLGGVGRGTVMVKKGNKNVCTVFKPAPQRRDQTREVYAKELVRRIAAMQKGAEMHESLQKMILAPFLVTNEGLEQMGQMNYAKPGYDRYGRVVKGKKPMKGINPIKGGGLNPSTVKEVRMEFDESVPGRPVAIVSVDSNFLPNDCNKKRRKKN